MNAVIEGDVRRDIGGDQQRIGALETDVGALTFKHVLLPIWLAAYRYRGKSFRFVVNGRTGAVQGERPWSASKIGRRRRGGGRHRRLIAALQIAQSRTDAQPAARPRRARRPARRRGRGRGASRRRR